MVNAVDSDYILSTLRPRLILSGHTHYSCHYRHEKYDVTEITVSTFNWRNRDDPSFVLALIDKDLPVGSGDERGPHPNIRLQRCYLPSESTVVGTYCVGAVVVVLEVSIAWTCRRRRRRNLAPCLPCKAKAI